MKMEASASHGVPARASPRAFGGKVVLLTPCVQAQTCAFQSMGTNFWLRMGAQESFLQKAEPQSPFVNFLLLANG